MLQPSQSSKSRSNPNLTPAAIGSAREERTTIGRSLIIKGEVSGAESLYIDGRIEGTVDFAGHCVTIGGNGSVAADITACEVVILGKVRGSIQCTDCLDVRSQGSLTGDVVTQRIRLEDGAIFKGSVQTRAIEQTANESQPAKAKLTELAAAEAAKPIVTEQPKAAAAAAGAGESAGFRPSVPAVPHDAGARFMERARTLIKGGYKPKDAVDLVLQDTALECRNDPGVMEKAHADAEDFLLKIRKGLI